MVKQTLLDAVNSVSWDTWQFGPRLCLSRAQTNHNLGSPLYIRNWTRKYLVWVFAADGESARKNSNPQQSLTEVVNSLFLLLSFRHCMR